MTLPVLEFLQPWGHGPIYINTVDGGVQAWCAACPWEGPDRTGDPHDTALAVFDAEWHAEMVGAEL